jgi:hypothetical protein
MLSTTLEIKLSLASIGARRAGSAAGAWSYRAASFDDKALPLLVVMRFPSGGKTMDDNG